MLYDLLLILPLFMAATAMWVAILGPTDSIAEPTVPASPAVGGLAADRHPVLRHFLAQRRPDPGHAGVAH